MKFKSSNFYVTSSLFVLLSVAGAILNYALYPSLAHILSARDLGDFTLTMAFSNQILAILSAFNVISIYLVKNFPEETARGYAQTVQKILVWLFLAATGLIIALSPILKNHLKVANATPFIILALLLVLTVPGVIWTGYLQGHKRLVKVGFYTFSASLSRLILSILLGIAGGVVGALWGVLAGTLIGVVALWLVAGIKLPSVSSVFTHLKPQERAFLKSTLLYILGAVLVVGGLGLMQNIDILFAKGFFNRDTAGVYSGISILSNGIYYIAFLLVWIILPEIDPKDAVTNGRVLKSAYKLLALLGAGTLIFEFILRNFLTKELLGPHFSGQGSILIYATLFQLSLVSVTIYAFYNLVLRSWRSTFLGLSVIIPCLVVPWFFHHDTKQMVASLWLAVVTGWLIYLLGVSLFPKRAA